MPPLLLFCYSVVLVGKINLIPFGVATGGAGVDGATPTAAAALEAATQVQAQLPGSPIALPTAAAAAATAPGVAINSTATLPKASAAPSHTHTATPTPAEPPGVLPAWTGLPHPPLWLKQEEQPEALPSKPGSNPVSTSFVPGGGAAAAAVGGTGSATSVEAAQQAVKGGGDAGAWSGGIGEKRPRLVVHVF